MRVKQIFDVIPLPAKCRLVWERLTSSRITTAYFIFSVFHCIIQVALQVRAFSINADAASYLWNFSLQAGAVNYSLPVPDLHHDFLRLCSDVPDSLVDPASQCKVVWNATKSSTPSEENVVSTSSSVLSSIVYSTSSSVVSSSVGTSTQTSVSTTATPSTSNNVRLAEATAASRTTTTVFVTETPKSDKHKHFAPRTYEIEVLGTNPNHSTVVAINGVKETLSTTCVWSLYWPVTVLDETKREDVVFIAFQFWVLGMSFVALLNESIPHIFASLSTHIMATAWSAYQIINTQSFRNTFNRVIIEGACDGVSLLPNYWNERAKAEYPLLAVNVASLFVSAFLTWRLIKLFGWQTFKRVGASLKINRIYKLVLCLSIVLQLSFFFTGATASLWIDNLINGIASRIVWYNAFYKAVSFVVAIFLIPWLVAGWIAIRKELRWLMFVFLFTSVLYLAGWSLMFLSTTFRWTFLNWHFFSVIASLSVFLTVSSLVLGVVCRYNFGKGLLRYLDAQEPLPGDDFTPVSPASDVEKVEFPSEKAVPTFSATFGSGDEVPVPRQMFPQRMGPRFFNRSAEPFETPSNRSEVTVPPIALSRTPSVESRSSAGREVTLARDNTQTSIGSFDSYYSYPSDARHNRMQSEDTMNGRRWVIE